MCSTALVLDTDFVSLLHTPEYHKLTEYPKNNSILSFYSPWLTCSSCWMEGTKYNWVALPYSRQNSSLILMALCMELEIYGLSSASILPTLKRNSVTNIYGKSEIRTVQSWARVYLKRLARRTCSPHKRNFNLTPSLSTRVICFICKLPDVPWISNGPIDSILQTKNKRS